MDGWTSINHIQYTYRTLVRINANDSINQHFIALVTLQNIRNRSKPELNTRFSEATRKTLSSFQCKFLEMIKPRMRIQIIPFETSEGFWLWRSLVRSMKWKTTSKQFTRPASTVIFLLFPAHIRCKNSTLRLNWLRRALSWSNVWYLIVNLKSVDAFIRYVDDECDSAVYSVLFHFLFPFPHSLVVVVADVRFSFERIEFCESRILFILEICNAWRLKKQTTLLQFWYSDIFYFSTFFSLGCCCFIFLVNGCYWRCRRSIWIFSVAMLLCIHFLTLGS